MYIVIAGAGQVGRRIADELERRGHETVVIDIDEDVCDEISLKIDSKIIHGDASNIRILEKAGIDNADVCIGLIGDDSSNLAFTILASAFEVPLNLARMKNSLYKTAYRKAGADRTFDMTEIYMDSLIMDIEHPKLETVARLGAGKVSIVVGVVPEESAAIGMSIAEIIMEEEFPAGCVFTGIYRGEEFIFPRGDEKIRGNDKIFLSGDSKSIREAVEYLGVK